MKSIKVINSDDIIIVDDEDYDRVISICDRWYVGFNRYKKPTGISGRNNITKEKVNLSTIVFGCKRMMQDLDHIDRNIFNNQKSNLRECSHSQNCRNTIKKENKTGYRGVYKRVGRYGYASRIRINRRTRLSLGIFDTAKDAAVAYNKAAIEYHGEFAVLNIIP